MREDMVMMSMLPPVRMGTTFWFLQSRWYRAATVRRPAFSTIILWVSVMSRKAETSSLSSMVMMSSKFS